MWWWLVSSIPDVPCPWFVISNHDLVGVYIYIGLCYFLDFLSMIYGIDGYRPCECVDLAAETVDLNILSQCKATRKDSRISKQSKQVNIVENNIYKITPLGFGVDPSNMEVWALSLPRSFCTHPVRWDEMMKSSQPWMTRAQGFHECELQEPSSLCVWHIYRI